MIEIIWHGHACFEIRGEYTTIVTDPFTGIGLPEPRTEADVVLCSHSHADHNHIHDHIKKPSGQVLESFIGSMTIGDVKVKGIGSFHDDVKGNERGENSIYVFDLDGVRFCHLGDLGHDLSSQDVETIGEIDVLFVPVGGIFTIGPNLAASLSTKLNPRIVFPMHYKIPGMNPMFNRLSNIEGFTTVVPLFMGMNIRTIKGSAFTIEKDDEGNYVFEPETTVAVLSTYHP